MNTVPANDKVDWRALSVGALLLLSTTGLMGLVALMVLVALINPDSDQQTSLTLLMLAGGLFFIALLLLPGAYLNGRKFFGLPDVQIALPRLDNRMLYPTLLLGWLLTLILGQIVSTSALSGILLPLLNGLAIGFPVVFLMRISLSGLKLPGARRAWSVLGVSLVSAPTLALIFECIAFVGFFLIFALYALATPELRDIFQQIAKTIQSPDAVSIPDELSAKILFAPGTLLAILGMFSVAIPIIEETVKMTALLLCANRVQRPSEGFVLGILCGTAFTLAENAGFTSMSADRWVLTSLTRASAALPHILNCGILGWALIAAWKERKYLQLGFAYLAVILIHGAWNAISVLMAYSALAALTPSWTPNLPAFIASPLPAGAGWLVMICGTFFGLIFANRQMRRQTAKEQNTEVVYNLPLPEKTFGENNGNPENPD